jgi:hypothetical protein
MQPLVSVAVAVNLYRPEVNGVPESEPVADKSKPVGKAPDEMVYE